MPHLTEIIAITALGFGSLLGLVGLFSPKWASGMVRLVANPDPDKPGGFAEFRALYGGFFLLLNLTALVIVTQPDLKIAYKVFTLFPISAAWIGAALGRTISMVMDKEDNRGAGINPLAIGVELVVGLAIAAPVMQLTA